MATDPANPYAPSAALAVEDAAQPPARRPWRRVGAIVLSIAAHPLSGAGLYVLGRPRRLAGWLAAALATWVLTIVAVRIESPEVFGVAVLATLIIFLAALIDTAFARRGQAIGIGRSWLVAIALLVAAKGGAVMSKRWLAEAFQVPSQSMLPTLLAGDHVMVRKGHGDVRRGDVVVFESPKQGGGDYVKRVIALGGDTVEVTRGVVSVNGAPLARADLEDDCPELEEPGWCQLRRETLAGRSYTIMSMPGQPALDGPPVAVPDGAVYLLGDNRDNSQDSRHFGPVTLEHVKGKVALIYLSRDAKTGVRWSRVGRRVE